MTSRQTNKTSSGSCSIVTLLAKRSIVLVGLMGCGKSSVGRRLAARIDIPFVDADEEIERAAGKTISEIFADYGEAHFRDRECKIIGRLLEENGPQVLATGGGAFMRLETRQAIARHGISVWLKAELSVLMGRVSRREGRPLLNTNDPLVTMQKLMAERYPVYKRADLIVESRNGSHDEVVHAIMSKMTHYLEIEGQS